MATVPDTSGLPTVAPQVSAPDNFQHVQASPDAFGGIVAEGEQHLAAGLQQASDNTLDALKFYDQIATDDAKNKYNSRRQAVLYGDPNKTVIGPDGKSVPDTGYFGKVGSDAMAARPQVMATLDSIGREESAGLHTQASRRDFDDYLQTSNLAVGDDVGRHAAQQQLVWARKVNQDTIDSKLHSLAVNPDNPKVALDVFTSLQSAYIKQDQLTFGSTVDPKASILRAKQDMAITLIRATLPKDPNRAQKLLDDNSSILAGLPSYDALSDTVRTQSRNMSVSPTADAALAAGVPGLGGTTSLANAILGQESGGNPGAKTSVTGAVGAFQIQPQTFAKYAQPGENIHNPADNRAVGQRIVDDLQRKYPNDPARVAVAYFSGEGNVAPPGSPTPWIKDRADPTGKTTSAYVSDIQNRLQNQTGRPRSLADYYRQNFPAILDNADTYAERIRPNDPEFKEMVRKRTEAKMTEIIVQQKESYTADNHMVITAAITPDSDGQLPTSIEALGAVGPDVKAAMDRMAIDSPDAYYNLVTKFLPANAHGQSITFGEKFYDFYRQIMAPDGDTARITDPKSLYAYIGAGEGAPLTTSGMKALQAAMAQRNSPHGNALAQAEVNFFKQMHGQLSTSNPALNIQDPKGDHAFNKYIIGALKEIQAGLGSGKTPAQLFDPKSPDYVGKAAGMYMRTPVQMMQDSVYGAPIPVGQGVVDLSTLAGAQAAFRAGKLSKKDADALALKNNWGVPPPPPVPIRK